MMAQSDFTLAAEGSTLVIQRWLPGPVERIWRYLVDNDLRRQWLASGDMTLAPGAAVELVWRNDDLSDSADPRPQGFAEEQRMQSRVIACDPMRRLTIAWGQGDVTFELESRGDKVLLTLTHRGLDQRSGRTGIAAGWRMHLDILAAQASGAEAPSFWSGWAKYREECERQLP